jgi:methylated-DNA-[protein]-cysteine S-methyltransferase
MSQPVPLVAQARADTPLGSIVLAATARGLAGLWFEGQKHQPGPLAAPEDARHPVICVTLAELARYWRGEAVCFSAPLEPSGTPFQRSVWRALAALPRGATTTYGALAAALGRPSAARAVGAAVGRNPLSIVVPCHRVLGQGGALTGYAGGPERKRALLELEGARHGPRQVAQAALAFTPP